MRPAKATLRMLSAVATVALLTGCGDGTGPNRGVAGDYALLLVNGEPPPAVVLDTIVPDTINDTDEHLVVEILDGSLDLDDLGTYGWTIRFDVYIDDQLIPNQLLGVSGSYEVNGDVIRLTPTADSLPATDATLDGRTITFSDSLPDRGEVTLTFQKPATDDNGDIY